MSYVLAVDVGTSFTAAAIARFDQGASSPECLPLGLRGTSVPSVLFYPDDGPVLVGEAAERRGLDSPGRVVREFKRRVGDAVPISVGTLSLAAEDVFATMARWVADRAEERQGAPPSEIILTYPAAWGFHRTSLIKAALAAKGLGNVTLLTEPEAAALHYASQVRVEDGSIIAVYDLGGGTFDTAVLRKEASNRFELLGKPEGFEHMGGADFDAALFRYVADHTDGALARLDPAGPGVLAALSRLRRECVEAKEALSSDSEANISVLLPGIQQQIRLVRPEFESLIEDPVRDTVDALEQSLGQLGLEPADLTAVLLIGGSSRIPLVAQLISEQLDRPIAVDADPKSSICMGAAVSAVLGRVALAAAESSADASGDVVPSPAPEGTQVPLRLASWSRNPAPSPGSLAAAALSSGQGDKGGAHGPKPRVRLTAVAATAVLLTVLTATAAQSPAGFNSLTSVFVPPAGASNDRPAVPATGAAGGGSGGGNGAGAAGDVEIPVAGGDSGMQRAAASQAPGPLADGKVASIRAIEKGASEGPSTSAAAAGGTGSTAPGDTATSGAATDTATSTGTPPTGDTTSPSPTESGDQSGTASPSPTESGGETPTPSATDSSTPEPTRNSSTAEPTPTDTAATPTESGRWLKPVKGSKLRNPTGSPSPTVQVSASPTGTSGSTSTAEESLVSGLSGTETATDTATATTAPAA